MTESEQMNIKQIKLSDYEYTLPEDSIAKFPLENRGDSKLIQYKDGELSHHRFFELPKLIPADTLMVFNNTKVIPARLIFQRESGARIEIFLLKPVFPSTVINEIMLNTESVVWETMIGNLKKWKPGEILKGNIQLGDKSVLLVAELTNREKNLVRFSWDDVTAPFVSLVEASGEVPLPPYLNRKPVPEDKPRYQTVYSKQEGAVAAPTAGLHFTDEILAQLIKNGVEEAFLTLHVSAGTFQPIKNETVIEHPMHSEQLVVDKDTLTKLASHNGKIVPVGTTSMRTLESLYWFGVKLLHEHKPDFIIAKLYPYTDFQKLPTRNESFQRVLDFMEGENKTELTGATEIFIMPGYDFKVCDGLVTNFHQPSSTLILLVAAFTQGNWKKIYDAALEKNYRFLSYGDSNLLWR